MPFSTSEVFLGENEFGFARISLGFPSISACRALIYHTGEGIYGYHLAAGYREDRCDTIGQKFADYVAGHPQGAGAGIGLYVVSRLGAGSTYSAGAPGMAQFLREIRAVATKLAYGGRIMAYDLSFRAGNLGTFVEATVNAGTCVLKVNPWREPPHGDDTHKALLTGPQLPSHRYWHPSQAAIKDITGMVFVKADTTGQERVDPYPLPA